MTAHLLIPGWTTTGAASTNKVLGCRIRLSILCARPSTGARSTFYARSETTPEMDRKRIQWAAGDITENRPPLSRWEKTWKARFEED